MIRWYLFIPWVGATLCLAWVSIAHSQTTDGVWKGEFLCAGSPPWTVALVAKSGIFTEQQRGGGANLELTGRLSPSGEIIFTGRQGRYERGDLYLSGQIAEGQLAAIGNTEWPGTTTMSKSAVTCRLSARHEGSNTGRSILDSTAVLSKATQKRRAWQGPAHLFAAIIHDNPDETQRLIKSGFDVNVENGDGDTPLHVAALMGNPAVVKLLLDGGAKPDHENLDGLMPRAFAEYYGHTAAAALLPALATSKPAVPQGLPGASAPVDQPRATHCTTGTVSPKAVSKPGDTRPKLFVLSIGVSQYRDPSMNLALAAKDACDVAQALTKQEGGLYSQAVVRVILDGSANKDGVLEGLEWVTKQAGSRDVAMVFVAGHGVNDGTGEYFFLPHDAQIDRLTRTAIAQSDIRRILGQIQGKAMFFFDTCHSGQIMATRRSLPPDVSPFVAALTAAENGVVVFSASTGRQFAIEDESWGNGAFTKALLEGLAGKADYKRDRVISLTELDLWLAERVKDITGGRQAPTVAKPTSIQDFPIAVVRR